MDILTTILLGIFLAIGAKLLLKFFRDEDGFTLGDDGMVTRKKGAEVKKPMSAKIPAAIFGFIIIILLIVSTITIVGAGERGVLVKFGEVQQKVYGEGLYFIVPIQDSMVKMTVRTQKYEVEATASTKDLLDVTTKVAVNFHLEPSKVNTLYQSIGPDYESTVIAPAVQEIVKATTAKFNAEELITEREIVKEQIDAALKDRLATRNLVVETTSITNFAFPDAFNQAITAKQTAVQRALEAQNKLEQVKFEAQQAVSKAEGDAKAMDIINQQLMKSPQYINYLAVQKWSGTLPLATGGAMPFIQLPTTT